MSGDDLELRVAWQRHVAREHDEVLESLLARHRAAGRHYHDVRHVRWVVRHVLDLADRVDVDDLDAIVAAAFFHDAIYERGRADNETASAELAARTLRDVGWHPDRCDRVAALIVATEHHAETPDVDADTAVLLAADLAVLAAEPAAYSDYARQVRREYGHLDDDAWQQGRGEVVRRFLDRDAIFPPQLGLDDWEARARANLTAELAGLLR